MFLLGCEENLAPRGFLDVSYSLYGVLSPDLDTQSVRLYPVEAFPHLTPESLGVAVASTDLVTGEETVWQESIVSSANGDTEHIFWAPFRAEYGHTYRIEAARPDSPVNTFAEVRIPDPVTVHILDPDTVLFRVSIEGGGIRVFKPEVVYGVRKSLRARTGPAGPVRSIPVSYQGTEQATADGWTIAVNLHLDRWIVQGEYTAEFRSGGIACPLLDLIDLELHVVVGDAPWDPPQGVFDPNVLSHHRALTNVQNGFGFIGGGYRIEAPLRPSQMVVEKGCFFYDW